MLELAKLQLLSGDLQSCQYLCDMVLKSDNHKHNATVVRTIVSTALAHCHYVMW